MKNLIHFIMILTLTLFIKTTIYSQVNTLWTKTFGGSSSDFGRFVEQTSDGGYILTGGTDSFGAGSRDIWLIKTDENGDEVWNKTYGGIGYEMGYSVKQTSDGGYILLGITSSFGAGEDDIWLIRTDSNGDSIWTKTYGGIDSDQAYSMILESDGSYVICGRTYSFGNGVRDIWLIKTNSMGDTLWTKTFGGIDDESGYLNKTTDGGYIITGSTFSFGAGEEDVWLIKIDENGNEVWNKTFGGINSDWGRSVEQTSDGGYIITGGYNWTPTTESDIWLIKTDENGNEVWNKTFGGTLDDWGTAVKQTLDGGYIVTGVTYSFGAGDQDIWLIKTNSMGDTLWTKTFGGIDFEFAYNLQLVSDGGYVIGGYTWSFGAGEADFWLVKVAEDINYPDEINISSSYSFNDFAQTSSYQIIGLPGDDNLPISDYLSGSSGKEGDWRAFRDPGSGNYEEYSNSSFNFGKGRAYWILSKNEFSVDETVGTGSLDPTDNTYSIPVHNEWNLITNPFDKTIPWSDVKTVNGLTDPIHYYESGSYDSTTDDFDPYMGYYFYNRTSGLTSLKIPFVSPVGGSMQKQQAEVTKELEILLSLAGESKSRIKVGFSEEANAGLDKLDIFSPPSTFCVIDLALYNENLETNYKYLNKEYREDIGEGQEFEMKLKNSTGKTVELRAIGMEDFDKYEIYLLDRRLNKLFNLREQSRVEVKGTVKSGELSLLVGTEGYIQEKKLHLLPEEYVLYQNYPNPFNPATTIRFALPADGNVTLNVYNILGELVTRLINNIYYPAGYHETDFDGKSLTSGIYLYTIQTGNFVTTRKMILIK